MNQQYALLIEYDGNNFYGWQRQKTFITIQSELETALSQIANQDVKIIAAGRTDTGVHALHQVVSFCTDAKRKDWMYSINNIIVKSIRCKAAVKVNDDFNARISAIKRTYHYYLLNQPTNSAILANYVGFCYYDLNIEYMQNAGNNLIGTHDFSSFCTAECKNKSRTRHVQKLSVERHNHMIRISITANSFLHHMVRNIVGALVYVGSEKTSISKFIEIFDAKNRIFAPPTYMPTGLYLVYVEYKNLLFAEHFSDNWLF